MSKDEALRIAMEALEVANSLVDGYYLEKGKAWMPEIEEAITAIKSALEAKDEPVATIDSLEQEIYENTRQFVSLDVMEWMLKRYYTTPPQRTWVGLTDEEIGVCLDVGNGSMGKIISAIQAKLKELNT